MPKQPKIYRRLPGTGTTLASHVRLYQGPDHLLQVTSTGFSERYKRFYFRDIQAIVLRKSVWGKVYNGILAVFVAIFAFPAFSLGGPGAVVMWSIAGFFFLCLLINLAFGPTSTCQIQTAVQTETLPTLKRLRSARKTLGRIKTRITEVQGGLSAADVAGPVRSSAPSGTSELHPHVATETMAAPPVIAPGDNAANH